MPRTKKTETSMRGEPSHAACRSVTWCGHAGDGGSSSKWETQ